MAGARNGGRRYGSAQREEKSLRGTERPQRTVFGLAAAQEREGGMGRVETHGSGGVDIAAIWMEEGASSN